MTGEIWISVALMCAALFIGAVHFAHAGEAYQRGLGFREIALSFITAIMCAGIGAFFFFDALLMWVAA